MTVIQLNNVRSKNANNVEHEREKSPIDFTAYERPIFFSGATGIPYEIADKKALVRYNEEQAKPHCLAVVNKSYKVVQNCDLFAAIDRGMENQLGKDEIASAKITDKVSYNGAKCFREYRFDNIAIDSPERDHIVFRIIVENGFGTGAIKLHAGAIDMFCTNGMILGEYNSTYAKHTSGVQMLKFENAVKMSVDVFWKNCDLYARMRSMRVAGDEAVHVWLKEKFSERLGTKIFHQYLVEKRVRGGSTMWALYSAMTAYASHETSFPVRGTTNDHTAATMFKRQSDVHRVFEQDHFASIAA